MTSILTPMTELAFIIRKSDKKNGDLISEAMLPGIFQHYAIMFEVC